MFQVYINQAMCGILDIYIIVYLDNILIYSQNKEEHVRHVQEILQWLEQYNLFTKLFKCKFYRHNICFLDLQVGVDSILIDPDQVLMIKDWLMLESYHNIQVFLGFTGFFQQFIENYIKITALLTNLL